MARITARKIERNPLRGEARKEALLLNALGLPDDQLDAPWEFVVVGYHHADDPYDDRFDPEFFDGDPVELDGKPVELD